MPREKETARSGGTGSARVIAVIETESTVGQGLTQEDPVRMVKQYWSLEGELLWVNDPAVRS